MRTVELRGAARRRLACIALVVATAAAGCGGGGSSTVQTKADGTLDLEGVTISYLGFGGSNDEAMREAWFEPFERETGARVVLDSPTDYKKVQAQVESGNVTYDLVDGDPYIVDPQCGKLFQPVDVDLSAVERQYRPNSLCGVPDYVFGYVIGYSTAQFGDDGPQDCREFFDTERYPGDRAVWSYYVSAIVECAAIAAGADPLDPYADIDLDAAFAQLDRIKDDLVIYTTVAQAIDQMVNGDVAMGIYPHRTIYDAVERGAEFTYATGWAARAYGSFAIPKGAPNAAAAEALLDYLIQPEVNQRLSRRHASAIGTPTGGKPKADLGRWRSLLPTIPPLSKVAMDIDWDWWARNDAVVGQRWNDYATTG